MSGSSARLGDGNWHLFLDDELRPTRPVPDPRRKIDYVMLSPGLHPTDVELLDVATCPSSRADGERCTDHRPLAGTVVAE